MTVTGAVRPSAADVEAILEETAATRLTERGRRAPTTARPRPSMEDRKREGYF